MALPANTPQWRSHRGRYHDHGEFHTTTVAAGTRPLYEPVFADGSRSAWFQLIQCRDRDGDSEGAFWRSFAVPDGVDKHLDGLAGVRRNEDGRRQESGAHPGLAGLRQAIATGKGKFQPALPVRFVRQFFEGLAAADGHGIVLRADQV